MGLFLSFKSGPCVFAVSVVPGVNYFSPVPWVKFHNKLTDVPANESFDRTQAISGVLQPGTTCWQMPRADRMAVIIDASDYFHDYIRYYNAERIKLGLGGLSPVTYRMQAAAAPA